MTSGAASFLFTVGLAALGFHQYDLAAYLILVAIEWTTAKAAPSWKPATSVLLVRMPPLGSNSELI